MTLSICVSDTIKVFDIVGFVKTLIKRVLSFFSAEDDTELVDGVNEEPNTNSPPDLGITVGDSVNIGEVLS